MIYIILAMVFYAVAIVLGAAASRNANTNLAAAITNLISAVVPIVAIVPLMGKQLFADSKRGIIFAVLGGVSIAFFVMAINKSYAVNKVGIVAPIVFGGAIFLSTVLSYFIFKEKISLLQFVGLMFLAIGFGVIIYARAVGK